MVQKIKSALFAKALQRELIDVVFNRKDLNGNKRSYKLDDNLFFKAHR